MTKHVVLDHCFNILKSEEIKSEIKELIKPFLNYILKEISLYLYFVIFLIILSFMLHLGILILLIKYNKNINS